MRKLTATFIAVLLSLGFATPAESNSTKWTAYQKTLATYSGNNTSLSSLQKSQIRATLDKAPLAEKFICTGIRYYDQPMSINIMVRKRAKEACEYAKQLKPSLSTWYQNKPTKARSYAGKVLLTVKSPVLESPEPEEKLVDKAEPSEPAIRSYQEMNTWVPYSRGLNVKVTKLDILEKANSTQLILNYSMTNVSTNRDFTEGSFSLFFQDGSKLRQFGMFNKIFPGGSSSRNYVFEWVGNKSPSLIEFEADFFANEPSKNGLLWEIDSNDGALDGKSNAEDDELEREEEGPFRPITSAGDVLPQINPVAPSSVATISHPAYLNAIVNESDIQWQLCRNNLSAPGYGVDPPLGDRNQCPVTSYGQNFTLPDREVFFEENNVGGQLQYLAATIRYDEVDPQTGLKTGRHAYLRTDRAVNGLEQREIKMLSKPQILGEAMPMGSVSLDTGEWQYAKEPTMSQWFICTELSDPYAEEHGISYIEYRQPGCSRRGSASEPLLLGTEGWNKGAGYVEVRAIFLLRQEGWGGNTKRITVSKPIEYSAQQTFDFALKSQSRQLCLPDMECVQAEYTITNTSDQFMQEQVPTIVTSNGNSYEPLSFRATEIPPGESQTRELVWQIRNELDSSMELQLGEQKQTRLRGPSDKQLPSITGIRAEVIDGRTVVRWNPVSSYIDGSQLVDEAFSDGTDLFYFTEVTGIAGVSQTQRRFNDNPSESFFADSGVDITVWVMGKRSISNPVSFYVFNEKVYPR